MKCKDIISCLEQLSPRKYACDWDNVGLLVGRKEKEVQKIMVALDASNEVVEYAIKEQVDMLITHHPLIFSALKQINEEQFIANKVLSLAENGIAYYAMHTNFDAAGGMAELAASDSYLNLSDTEPMELCSEDGTGMGRYGKLPVPMTAAEVATYVKDKFHLSYVTLYQSATDKEKVFDSIAVMPGSGKSFMKEVKAKGYELYLTGDFGHHEGIDAMDMGLTVIDATHYGLEHIFISFISEYLKSQWKDELTIIEADMGCPGKVL